MLSVLLLWSVLSLSLLNPTGSALQLRVTPGTVVAGLSKSLEINCTFSYQSVPQISNLISLVISKSDDHSSTSTPISHELASINEFNPDQVKMIRPVNASISGHINGDGTSYLSFQWAYPSAAVAGLYRCNALGVDTFGHVVDSEDTKLVTITKPGLDQLIDAVRLQQLQMDSFVQALSSLSTSLAKVDSKVSTLGHDFGMLKNEVRTQNNTLTDRMKELREYKDIQMLPLTMSYIRSDDYRGRYYLLSTDTRLDIMTDQAACLIQGGYLAEINDQKEHDFFIDFLNGSLPQHYGGAFLGPVERNQKGEWEFRQSHQVMSYNASAIFGLDNVVNRNRMVCLYMDRRNDWTITSTYCFSYVTLYPFLCEIPRQ